MSGNRGVVCSWSWNNQTCYQVREGMIYTLSFGGEKMASVSFV